MRSGSSVEFLHFLQTLLGGLLRFFGVVGVVDGSLKTACDVVGILFTFRLGGGLKVTGLQNL